MITFVSWVQSLRKDCSLYEGIQLLELKVLLFFVIIRLALSTPQRTLGYPSYPSYPDMVVLLTLNARLVRSCPYTIVLLTLFILKRVGSFYILADKLTHCARSPTPDGAVRIHCRFEVSGADEAKYERVGSGNGARSADARSRLKLKLAARKTAAWGVGASKGKEKGKGSSNSSSSNGSSSSSSSSSRNNTTNSSAGLNSGSAGAASAAGKKKKGKKKKKSLPAHVLASLNTTTAAAASAAAAAAVTTPAATSTPTPANASEAEVGSGTQAPMHPKLKRLLALKNPTPAQSKLRDAILNTLSAA